MNIEFCRYHIKHNFFYKIGRKLRSKCHSILLPTNLKLYLKNLKILSTMNEISILILMCLKYMINITKV